MIHVFDHHRKVVVWFIGYVDDAVRCNAGFEDSTFVVKVEHFTGMFCKVGLRTKDEDFSLSEVEGCCFNVDWLSSRVCDSPAHFAAVVYFGGTREVSNVGDLGRLKRFNKVGFDGSDGNECSRIKDKGMNFLLSPCCDRC